MKKTDENEAAEYLRRSIQQSRLNEVRQTPIGDFFWAENLELRSGIAILEDGSKEVILSLLFSGHWNGVKDDMTLQVDCPPGRGIPFALLLASAAKDAIKEGPEWLEKYPDV